MRIYLRPITLDDGTMIVKWRNTLKVQAHCLRKEQITIEDNEVFFKNYVSTGKYKQFIVERVEETTGVISYPIATVYLKDFDNFNHRCQFCIFTSDDEEWNTESQSIAIKMLLDKAFNEYNMHKVYSYAFPENKDEIDLLKKAGFTIEALLKNEAVDLNGNYSDIIRLCIVKEG